MVAIAISRCARSQHDDRRVASFSAPPRGVKTGHPGMPQQELSSKLTGSVTNLPVISGASETATDIASKPNRSREFSDNAGSTAKC